MLTLIEKLKANTEKLLLSFSELDQNDLHYKTEPTSWTVMECIEHIFLVDVGVSKVLTTNAEGKKSSNTQKELFSDERLSSLLVNRSYKVPAPEFVSPKNRFSTADEAQKSIRIIIEKIEFHLKQNDIESETITIRHAALGEMTKTDWVHFLIHHTNRHILQIEEIKQKLVNLKN
jgi:uncharacterized damage-inducible protein DinB